MARYKAWRRVAALAGALGASFTMASARADGVLSTIVISKDPVVYDLPQILALTDRNHPNLAAARAKVAQARAQLDEAHVAPFSQFKLTGGVALAPTLKGNNVFSPNTDVSLTSSLARRVARRHRGRRPALDLRQDHQPLGRRRRRRPRAARPSVEKERDAVRVDVRKAYFGLQLARDSTAPVEGRAMPARQGRRRAAEADRQGRRRPHRPRSSSRPTRPSSTCAESEAERYVTRRPRRPALLHGRARPRHPGHAPPPAEARARPRHPLPQRRRRSTGPRSPWPAHGVAARTAQVHLAALAALPRHRPRPLGRA